MADSSILSDEESFVILGSSPRSSLSLHDQLDSSDSMRSIGKPELELIHQELKGNENNTSTTSESLTKSSLDGSTQQTSVKEVRNDAAVAAGIDLKNVLVTSNKTENGNIKTSSSSSAQSSLGAAANESLAASFILGDVNADVLKTSVYSQFPSLCSLEASEVDLNKLKTFMSEYVELKCALSKVNETMKEFYTKTKQWKDEMHQMEANYQKHLQECQEKITMLQNENLDLKRDVFNKMEEIKTSEIVRQKEHLELVQALSDKTSTMDNMRAQMLKLEQQQLVSFDQLSTQSDNTNYVDRLDHDRVVKGFERQLSELLAKNLDLTDNQNQYIDEINCLKVNLVAAEELIKQNQAEVNLLKADNIQKSASFDTYKSEYDDIKEEVALLRQQVEVYRRDFEMERNGRQDLAGEKDQLLQDLRALQRKNQGLIEEAQRHYESMEKQRSRDGSTEKASVMTPTKFVVKPNQRPIRVLPTPSGSDKQISTFGCPICSKTFKNPSILDRHVNDCLDRQTST